MIQDLSGRNSNLGELITNIRVTCGKGTSRLVIADGNFRRVAANHCEASDPLIR